MRLCFALPLAVAAVTLAGCGSPTAQWKYTPPAPDTGVIYEMHGDGKVMSGRAETGSFTWGGQSLEIKDQRVLANGKDYGPVKTGDVIVLGTDGKLSVNGEPRTPQ